MTNFTNISRAILKSLEYLLIFGINGKNEPVKCNMMQLTNKRTSKIQASYKLEGTALENVESIKYLGVRI